jgi:hypothetical protein
MRMYVAVKQRERSVVTKIFLLQNRCRRINHHRFLFLFHFSQFFFVLFFFYIKHHQHNIKEARDNQTIEQHIDTCALVAV